MIKKYPFYADYTVAKDVYKTEADATTLAIKAVLICRAEMTDDDVMHSPRRCLRISPSLLRTR